ncbi:MAG: 4-(cytidine 5'-diphospho)-2-C-methyl-D-erythritol kinase [Firmicutes bacterium HGW-Firmicutes-1]|nr:MAG: 4-(cytidine 5'-diphospho)-2-C-methyl-D-erythritol kinase [Firmicutes bacterium HGW-Firmicutes-1]
MNEIRMKARAKINISLDVIRKREDGYHDLSMIMQTINLYDKVNIKLGAKKASPITIKTNLSFLPTDDKNLVYKVIEYMKTVYELKENIFVDLYKVIPIAAGLAGGSADAAATIKAMNLLFGLELKVEEMIAIGKQFGADIPYCLVEGTVLAEGIGDEMTYLQPFPECIVVIAKPNISVSTAFVYGNLKLDQVKKRPNNPLLIEAINKGDFGIISKNLCNVLEEVTIPEYPVIEQIKDSMLLHGASGALMSGSGSAVFGLFEDKQQAVLATSILKKQEHIKFAYATTVYNRERDSDHGQ